MDETTAYIAAFKREFAHIEQAVAKRLTERRWQHTQGVANVAVQLALHWEADAKKAYVAGLLHDVARELPRNRLLKAAADFGIVMTASERAITALMHAPVGAALARFEFEVTDSHVLAAIRYHTTGRAGMSLLEKIIFLADYIEPRRSFVGLERVRQAAYHSLDEAVLIAMTQIIKYLLDHDRCVAVEMVEARNDLLDHLGTMS